MAPLPALTPPPVPPAHNEFLLKPNRQPMLWAAIAYSAGIVAGIYFLTTREWLAVTLALATFFTGGALEIQLRSSSNIRQLRHSRASGQQLKLCALGFDTPHV